MSLPLVLITGVTGFVGAHVLQQALEAGYPVRAAVRPPKVKVLRDFYGDRVDIVPIDDVATGDYSEALKGVGAVIHVAAALANRATSEELMRTAIDGSLNILSQTTAAGIKRIVITSSWATAMNPDDQAQAFSSYVYTENDWNPATREQALDGTREPFWVYSAAKTIAEQEVWKFADAHPEIDVTTINPPFIFGAFAPPTKADIEPTSPHGRFYHAILSPRGGGRLGVPQRAPITVDVRDVARAHVLALRAPPAAAVGRKRLLVSGPNWSLRDAVAHIAATCPELRTRLPDVTDAPHLTIARVDTSRARDVLGLAVYRDWTETVDATVDTVLEAERRASGVSGA